MLFLVDSVKVVNKFITRNIVQAYYHFLLPPLEGNHLNSNEFHLGVNMSK